MKERFKSNLTSSLVFSQIEDPCQARYAASCATQRGSTRIKHSETCFSGLAGLLQSGLQLAKESIFVQQFIDIPENKCFAMFQCRRIYVSIVRRRALKDVLGTRSMQKDSKKGRRFAEGATVTAESGMQSQEDRAIAQHSAFYCSTSR